MTEPLTYCPYLGLAAEPTLVRHGPNDGHRCYAQRPPGAPDVPYQGEYCLSVNHAACPFYQNALAQKLPTPNADMTPATATSGEQKRPRWLPLLLWLVPAALALVLVFVYLRDAGTLSPAAGPTAQIAASSATPTASLAAPSPQQPTAGSTVALAVAGSPRYSTATPEPGGQIITLVPQAGEAGWWTGGDASGNHLGDSYLYTGYANGNGFISAIRFELASVPRGAPIRAAELRLTGLNDERFDPNAGGTWSVQLLPQDAAPDLAAIDFQALLNAPAAVTLLPTFFPADLRVGAINVAQLDAAGRAWLEQQIALGKPAVIARIVGPTGGDTLFAWDSGAGPASVGEGPRFALALGPAPATAPPLPTEAVIVATDTPTPANVLTAAAYANAATATVQANGGTPPAQAFRFVTPTPSPENIATVQARALLRGDTPVVLHTATPANAATADWLNFIATAEAILTGTPTPLPAVYVTPVIITPTPAPENVLTAVAQRWTAIAEATAGVVQPTWPPNGILATLTPPVFVIVNTPPPLNQATAAARAAYATAVTMLTGTFTPFPYNAVTATPTPLPPAPRIAPTPRPPAPAPAPAPTATPAPPPAP